MKPIELIKRLRQLTGSPIIQCKAAIEACNNDIEQSLEWLRAKGHASAAKRSGLTVSQGLVGCAERSGRSAMIEVLCETDFVAKNDRFIEFGEWALEKLLDDGTVEGEEVEERRLSVVTSTQENVALRRTALFIADPGTTISRYVHNAINERFGKSACMVKLKSSATDIAHLGEMLCM
jgi:elongation factor Ts